ncbi:MAG TPA: TMEM175 family protein [Hanamia sp.]|nr:TMEM175 family protein [Hanamia sp.]HZI68194.1 TMEM175 family protein [Hanamia sp.]
MREPKHDKERQDFQLERFTFFTDGVCAICITLLVIEIKVPELPLPTDHLLWQSISHLSLRFLGFVISFGIIGHYWSVHHRIFGYVVKYTTGLLWLNLAFLFTVVLLPFSSGFLGQYSSYSNLKLPYAVYTFNMVLTGLMNCWLWLYVSNPKRKMLSREISRARIKLGLYRSLVIPVVFFISFLVSLFLPIISKLILLLIPIILHWGMKGLEKRAEIEEIQEHKLAAEGKAAHTIKQIS